MGIAYGSGGAQSAFNTGTSVAVPSGCAAGDVVLIVAVGATSGQTFTYPSGFTQKAVATSGAVTLTVAWKRLTGADSGNYTMSSSASFTAQAHRFTGAISTGDPFRQTPDCEAGSPSEPDTSLTGVPAGDMLVHLAATNNGSHAINTPTGYTAQNTNGARMGVQTKLQSVTGDTGAVNGGTSTAFNPFAAMLFSLVPQPAAPHPWFGTGSGSLTIGVLPSLESALPLTGTGSLSVSTLPALQNSALTAGEGTLELASTVTADTACTLDGQGSLTSIVSDLSSIQLVETSSVGSLSTLDYLSTSAAKLHLSGDGSLSTNTSLPEITTILAVSGSGNLATHINLVSTSSRPQLSGEGSLDTTGFNISGATARFGGSGSLSLTSENVSAAALVSLSAAGQLNFMTLAEVEIEIAATGNGFLSVSASPELSAVDLSVQGTGSLDTNTFPELSAYINTESSGTLSTNISPEFLTVLDIGSDGSLSTNVSSGFSTDVETQSDGYLGTNISLDAFGILQSESTGQLQTLGGSSIPVGIVQIISTGTLEASAQAEVRQILLLSSTGNADLQTGLTVGAELGLESSGSLTVLGSKSDAFQVPLSGIGSLTLTGEADFHAVLSSDSTGALAEISTPFAHSQIQLSSQGSLETTARLITAAYALSLSGAGTLVITRWFQSRDISLAFYQSATQRWDMSISNNETIRYSIGSSRFEFEMG